MTALRASVSSTPSPVTPDRALRRLILVVYAAALVLTAASLLLDSHVRAGEVGPAIAIQVVIGAWLLAGERARRQLRMLGLLAYVASVLLLRDGAGVSGGFGPLVLLPVGWAALFGRRRELAVAVLAVPLVYIAPVLVIGPPAYASSQLRAGLLFTVVAGGLGVAVLQLVRRLAELARTDELTGLPNRRVWQEGLERELRCAERTGRHVTVVLIDLDAFKGYNDAHGHLAADRLLQNATAAWRRVLRSTDLLARWGGDEFGLLLCDATEVSAADVVARMCGVAPHVAFSAGVASARAGDTADDVLGRADMALYQAKAERRANEPSVDRPREIADAGTVIPIRAAGTKPSAGRRPPSMIRWAGA